MFKLAPDNVTASFSDKLEEFVEENKILSLFCADTSSFKSAKIVPKEINCLCQCDEFNIAKLSDALINAKI